jgi:superfamily II DNA/RNA helicase
VFPERVVRTHRVEPGECERRLLACMSRVFREVSLLPFMQSSLGQALMSSPEALETQIGRMAERDSDFRDFATEVRQILQVDPARAKLRGLGELIKQLAEARPTDWRLVVFTSRIETQNAIGRYLKALGVPHGFIAGGKGHANQQAIRAFQRTPPGIRVIVSTDAGAEGVNLQVANVLVNFDLPWNPMVLEQRIGRIQRLGTSHAQVHILNLVLAGSVEERVVARLSAKLQTISESIGDIEGILESAGGDLEEDNSYEGMISKLVVESLKGVDVEASTRSKERSIEEAKRVYEQEQRTVEDTLGDLTGLHRTGPSVPDITPITPSMPPEDFVLSALRADGAETTNIGQDLWAINLVGHNEFKAAFTEEAAEAATPTEMWFAANAPRLYVPGRRDFERLAQTWVGR